MLVGVKDPIRLLRRIAVSVVGTVILVVGVVLLVAPGPGLVVIALALAVFAIEYQWARRNFVVVQTRAVRRPSRRQPAALPLPPLRVKDMTTGVFGRLGALVSDVRACLGLRDGVWADRQPRAAAVWSAGELLDGGRGDRGEEVDEVAVGVAEQQ